jgi:hypothetical protein
LAIAVIFASDIVYSWYKRQLTSEPRKIFDIVMVIFGVLAFVFSDVEFWYRIFIIIILAIIGIAIHILWPRITKHIIFQSPIIKRENSERRHDKPVVPPVSMYSSHQLSWNELFAWTNNEICIQGITLESLNDVRPTIESALQQNKKIKLLYCKKDTELMPKIEKLVVSSSTADRIKSAIDMVNDIRDALGSDDIMRSNIEMRWHNEIPTMSLVILDPRSDSGLMQFEPYPYKTSQGDRKVFIIKQAEHPDIFGVYRGAFDKLWNDAHTAS